MIKIENLNFAYDSRHPICEFLDLEVADDEIVGVMGPSGCGKSTLLRLISGFLRQHSGRILVAGREVSEWRPQERPTSMVFQSYAVFPYMSVYDNLAFGLRVRRLDARTIGSKVHEIADMLELRNVIHAPAKQLSGGQRQRVAIGRSLAIEPRVLLLDEPLSSIDERLRDDLRFLIRDVLKSKHMSAILVSHAFQDTASLCDKVTFWDGRRLTPSDTVESWIKSPRKTVIAEMMGFQNIVPLDWLRGVSSENHKDLNAVNSGRALIPEDSIEIAKAREVKADESKIVLNGIIKALRWRSTRQYAIVDAADVILETQIDCPLNEGTPVVVTIDPKSVTWLED